MRVTQTMLNNQMLRNLQANNQRMEKYQEMLATGKKINKPSDDPVGVSNVMRYKAELERNDQYKRNLDSIKSYLQTMDSAISKVNDILQRARELAVQGATDTVPQAAKDNIAAEIDQLFDELQKTGNTKFNGKYIFNGQVTDTQPYTNPLIDNADTNPLELAVSDGTRMQYNISGQDVFGASVDPDNAFRILDDLRTQLRTGTSAGVSAIIGLIDSRMTKVHNAWAEVGARENRVDLIQNRLEDMGYNLTELRTRTEDADMAEVITNLKMAENVQRSALAAGARVIQPTLVDFLR